MSGRNAPVNGIEKMTGPTIATVPLRVKVNHQNSIRDSLHKLHEQTEAMIPFEQTGLQHIRPFILEIAEAIYFRTLLVVQPPEQNHGSAIHKKPYANLNARLAFGSYGLLWECTM